MNRIVIVSDLHCGAPCALSSKPKNAVQKTLLKCWKDNIDHFGAEPDVLVMNGDAIDGEDKKGRDIDENSIHAQVQDACDLLSMWKPKKIHFVSGSPYHTGSTVMMEEFLASFFRYKGVESEFHCMLERTISKWFLLYCRHQVGRSSLPHCRHSAPAKERVNQVLQACLESVYTEKPPVWPNFMAFSHVHYWGYCEDIFSAACTTPCWKAFGDRYGAEGFGDICNIGSIQLRVGDHKEDGWQLDKRFYPARLPRKLVAL